MKRTFDKQVLLQLCQKAHLDTILDPDKIGFFGCVYKKGEYLCQPCEEEHHLQIVVEGQVSIYHIRDDGAKYSLTLGSGVFLLGDMEFYQPSPPLFFAEAMTETVSIVIPLAQYGDALKHDVRFLNFLVGVLSQKLFTIVCSDAANASLTDRVLNHLKYHCENGLLYGLEKSVFQLHCSSAGRAIPTD
ncbi:Crp/Fnr family transcriptional regulator [Chordicoccus furentiruminis]|uniref:Crp/Fnr family transcriptional regulator n=1 Tax=Chordicoccus furentiruminis TaxID=2709410 RepID=UPI0023A8B8C1|nr:cyclic nucleotide-binding domain-containing protein [Chordicoccus furentiruminis]